MHEGLSSELNFAARHRVVQALVSQATMSFTEKRNLAFMSSSNPSEGLSPRWISAHSLIGMRITSKCSLARVAAT